MEEVAWFVGIDWASQSHHVCLVGARGESLAERTVRKVVRGSPSCATGCLPAPPARAEAIAVAIEVPHGPVVEVLLERGFRVHAINPKQLDRFRDRFTVASAKRLLPRRRGMTGVMHGCSPTACTPTATSSASCRPMIR